jgi:hypothetical protein
LGYIAKAILNREGDHAEDGQPSEEDLIQYWKLLLIYDGLVLGPLISPGNIADVVKYRCSQFLAGDWDSLLKEHFSFRDPSYSPPSQPTSDDPLDALANRAIPTR